MRIQQFSVLLRNEPGVLSKILKSLSKENINIVGLTINENANFGELRLVVDDPEKTKAILKDMAVSYNVVKIIVVKLPNKPGELLKIANLLSESDINIDYIYTLASTKNFGYVAIKTWNMTDTENLLKEYSIDSVEDIC